VIDQRRQTDEQRRAYHELKGAIDAVTTASGGWQKLLPLSRRIPEVDVTSAQREALWSAHSAAARRLYPTGGWRRANDRSMANLRAARRRAQMAAELDDGAII
jgi:hypothetical protein